VEKIHAEEAAVITMETPQIVGACNVHPLAGREAVVGNNNGKRQIYERGQRCNDRGKAPASGHRDIGEGGACAWGYLRKGGGNGEQQKKTENRVWDDGDETHGVRSGQTGGGRAFAECIQTNWAEGRDLSVTATS